MSALLNFQNLFPLVFIMGLGGFTITFAVITYIASKKTAERYKDPVNGLGGSGTDPTSAQLIFDADSATKRDLVNMISIISLFALIFYVFGPGVLPSIKFA